MRGRAGVDFSGDIRGRQHTQHGVRDNWIHPASCTERGSKGLLEVP